MRAQRDVPPHPQLGFSLVELLIAMVIGLGIVVGVVSVYLASIQSFRFQGSVGRSQEDGTFALNTIARDLRMAGYAGCPGIFKSVVAAPPTSVSYFPASVISLGGANRIDGSNPLAIVEPANPDVIVQPLTPSNFIRGFDSIPAGMFAIGSSPAANTANSLFFASGSSKSIAVSSLMSSSNSNLTLAADTYGLANKVYDMIVSNCATSSIFKGNLTVGGGLVSIEHGIDQGNGQPTFPSGTRFGTDAIVMLVEWSFYYVATRAGASTSSLYRVFFNGNTRGAPEEIVANVESMRLNYGEDTSSGTPTLTADSWRLNAASVTDWSRVVAVRVGLMMVSAEDNVNPGVSLAVPGLLGRPYSMPPGASLNRLRKEFSTTVVLRNRVAAH